LTHFEVKTLVGNSIALKKTNKNKTLKKLNGYIKIASPTKEPENHGY
jgi:hypothetical protein